jgi:hypothetical protein
LTLASSVKPHSHDSGPEYQMTASVRADWIDAVDEQFGLTGLARPAATRD